VLGILTKYLTLYPDASDLHQRWCDCGNDLAWPLISHPDPDSDDPAIALSLASQVVERSATSSVYSNTLGVAYFRTANFASAVVTLDYVIAPSGRGVAFDYVFLAMSDARLRNREELQRCFVKAVIEKEKSHPGHAELARFCDEAQLIIGQGLDAPAVAR
jgi:hypothetical protein